MSSSQSVGATGELIAQARLLRRGWIVENVNSGGYQNAPAVDLIAAKGDRKITIAVKTTGHSSGSVQWGVKPDWTTLFKGETRPDFVIFIRFTSLDNCEVYVVPAGVVDAAMFAAHEPWHAHPRRDGSARKHSRHTAFRWDGTPTDGNVARGFAEKWQDYKDAWQLLDQGEPSTASS